MEDRRPARRPIYVRGAVARGRRVLRRWLPRPAETPRLDPFAAYRDPSGPALTSGPTPRRDATLDAQGRLVVLMPHLTLGRMSGGPNTIFQVTARLAAEGIRLRYAATYGPMDADATALREHIRHVTGVDPSPGQVDFVDASGDGATLDLGADDVLMATWWPTAHVANNALALVRASAFVYLIQDFEPGFYPWSTKYALADATYGMPIRSIVNEPMLLAHLRRDGAAHPSLVDEDSVVSFVPAVDRTVFAARTPRADRPRRLAFYARPKNPRNLFDLGLAALRTAASRGVFDSGEWEFRAIGQDLPDLPISDRHTLRAVPWLDYAAYGAFLRDTDVLLSPMLSPHTSYPPLEMAATGGHVVTTTFGGKTAEALSAISRTIHGVAPDLDALASALQAAVRAVEADEARGEPTMPPVVDLPASWDDALRAVVPWLARTIRELHAPG